jgi:hypothetical protein
MDLLSHLQWRLVPERLAKLAEEHREAIAEAWTKESGYSDYLATIAQNLNYLPGKYLGTIPNHASPLTGMLFGGLAGAGLGYGAGALGEKLLPNNWERGKLRRSLALLGGALGATIPAGMGATNLIGNKPFNDMSMWQSAVKTLPQEAHETIKQAYQSTTGLFDLEPIDVNEFNQIVWKDPRVSQPMTPQMQAAATGLLTGAANLPGKQNPRWVTPMDVGRMAAGMGAGYLSGALVGAGLGALMGMPPETQDKLKSTGMWAGLVTSLVPKAFGLS